MKKKYIKKLLIIAFLAFIVMNIMAYQQAYWLTHYTENTQNVVNHTEMNMFQKISVLFTGIKTAKPQLTAYPREESETILLKSNETLEGWLVEKDSSKGIVILFHGHLGTKSSLIEYSEAFGVLGYSTFMIDFMGSGNSEGYTTTIGFQESENVETAFNYIKKRFPETEVVLFGHSLGAAAIMKAVADKRVFPDKVIVQSPFGTMLKTVKKRFEIFGIPSFPLAELLVFYGGWQNDFNAFDHNPTDYARQMNVPTLLLYGAKDDRVDRSETEEIHNHLSDPKKLHIFETVGHSGFLKNKKEWLETVQSFCNYSGTFFAKS
jgi:alpha-beta hydrolase superfamily lysophospholipase